MAYLPFCLSVVRYRKQTYAEFKTNSQKWHRIWNIINVVTVPFAITHNSIRVKWKPKLIQIKTNGKTTKTYPPLHKLMPHTRQVKIHRALWINPSFLGDVHPVRVGEMLKFLWCSLKMFLSTDAVSTCVLTLITISSACFLDVLQNAGCVNSTQTWLFNISSYILNKINDNEIKRLIKTKQLSL